VKINNLDTCCEQAGRGGKDCERISHEVSSFSFNVRVYDCHNNKNMITVNILLRPGLPASENNTLACGTLSYAYVSYDNSSFLSNALIFVSELFPYYFFNKRQKY
jgi:hypothetical protein